MKRTTIHLPEPVRVYLKGMAKRDDTQVSELIRKAITEFIQREAKSQPVWWTSEPIGPKRAAKKKGK